MVALRGEVIIKLMFHYVLKNQSSITNSLCKFPGYYNRRLSFCILSGDVSSLCDRLYCGTSGSIGLTVSSDEGALSPARLAL